MIKLFPQLFFPGFINIWYDFQQKIIREIEEWGRREMTVKKSLCGYIILPFTSAVNL